MENVTDVKKYSTKTSKAYHQSKETLTPQHSKCGMVLWKVTRNSYTAIEDEDTPHPSEYIFSELSKNLQHVLDVQKTIRVKWNA